MNRPVDDEYSRCQSLYNPVIVSYCIPSNLNWLPELGLVSARIEPKAPYEM